ncbi:MAG: aldo/keto reductase [Candidatus Aminicenantes bacterium]|nr:aldo/keto reductase [Candidatus Aminicenantes bacterium]
MSSEKSMNRRNFLKNSALGVVGAGVISGGQTAFAGQEEESTAPTPKIKQYRTLGRTGFKVSDISSGGGRDEAVFNALLDAGVNYIDTAEGYGRGKSEIAAGKAIKNRDRKSLFITSKLVIKKDESKEDIVKRARKSLERLQTDYLDCLMIHSPTKIETVKLASFHEAVKQLKNEGRLKFAGLSNHGAQWPGDEDNMEKICLTAAADGRFDVMLFVYNFMKKEAERVLKVCREKNIGVTLMKTNPVGAYHYMKERMETMKKEGKKAPEFWTKVMPALEVKAQKAEGYIKKHNLKNPAEIRNAAIKFVLQHPDVHTVCCSVRNFDDVDTYLKLSGCGLTPAEEKKLSAYAEGCGQFYCRHACGICESKCPHNVPVNTIMRYNHYFEAQGREKYALEKYAALPAVKADRCFQCDGFCETACPYGVPIHGLLGMAHRRLTLA